MPKFKTKQYYYYMLKLNLIIVHKKYKKTNFIKY